MSSNLSLDGILNLTFGSFTRGKDAEAEIADVYGAGVSRGIKSGAKKANKKAAGDFESAWASLYQAGMKRTAGDLKKFHDKSQRLQGKLSEELQEVEERIEKDKDGSQSKRLLKERESIRKKIKDERKALDSQLKIAKNSAQERIKLFEAYEEHASKTSLERAKESGESFQSFIEAAMSPDSMSAKGFAESISKGLEGALGSGAGKSASGGNAEMASSLASVAGAVGAIAAPLAAVVGVLSMAVSGATDLNKSLLDSATSADIMGQSMVSVTGPLGGEIKGLNLRLMMLRKTVHNVASEFNMSTDEISQAVGAINEAGITVSAFRNFVGDAKNDMEAYSSVTKAAVVSSQALGVSASETGEFMSKLFNDMGVRLDGVQDAFGLIFSEAGKAGLSTKNFFAAINEASAGMALYNFRLTDTVGLYSDMVNILGEDMAREKLKLEGTFRNMGRQERYKTVMTTGASTGRIIKAEAETSKDDFTKKFGKLLGEGGPLSRLSGKDGGMDLSKLEGLSDKQFRAVLHQTRKEDTNAARQLENLRDLSKGMNGGMTAQADALGALGKGGELAMQLSQANAILGKPISELSGLSAAAFEEITGQSGENLEVLRRLDRGLRGEFEALVAANDPRVVGMTFEEALTKGLLSQSKELEAASETQYSLAERAAQEQLKESRSMTQTLQNTVAGLLENIWLGIESLVSMFGIKYGSDPDSLESRRTSMASEDSLSRAIEKIGGDISIKKDQLLTENDAAKRTKLKEEITALEQEALAAREKIDKERSFRKELLSGKTADEARTSAASKDFSDRFGMSAEDYAKNVSPTQLRGLGASSNLSVTAGEGASYRGVSGRMAPEMVKQALMLGELTKEDAEGMGFQVAVAPLEKLTVEQIETLTKQAQESRSQEIKIAEKSDEIAEDQVKGLSQIEDLIGKAEAAKLAGAAGVSMSELNEAMIQGPAGQKTIISKVKAAIEDGSISKAQGQEYLAYANLDYGDPVQDFIYRGNGISGEITPIDKMDQFFGAKPGGAMNQAMNSAGGNKSVVINISGGDESRIFAVVSKVLKDTGYSDKRSY